MPRAAAHFVKSAIRLERQSTTVPNTAKTNAFTAGASGITLMAHPVYRSKMFRFCHPGMRLAQALSKINPASHPSHQLSQPTPKHLAILHEPGIVGDLVIEDTCLCVGRLRQPVHGARARRLGRLLPRFDQSGPPSKPTSALIDE